VSGPGAGSRPIDRLRTRRRGGERTRAATLRRRRPLTGIPIPLAAAATPPVPAAPAGAAPEAGQSVPVSPVTWSTTFTLPDSARRGGGAANGAIYAMRHSGVTAYHPWDP
jgi:hypothetical protein